MEKFTKFLKFAFPLHNKNKKLLYNERGMDMKDFIEWLGVNEKIAKLVVWIFIIFVMLITTNAMLDSIGFPHYQLTYENLKQVDMKKIPDFVVSIIFTFFNFYTIALLVFRIKDARKIIKYSILYLLLNGLFTKLLGSGMTQVFIAIYMLWFAYIFSNKKYKYVLYTLGSLILNAIIQGITYIYKVQFIDYSRVSNLTKLLLFTDYFIIMGIIILVKEIYLKKRSEKND